MIERRALVFTIAALAILGCNGPQWTPPNWDLSRHREALASDVEQRVDVTDAPLPPRFTILGEDEFPRAVHPPHEPPPSVAERTLLVLCNVDDDDQDGEADWEDDRVNDPAGPKVPRDADDLALVTLPRFAGAADSALMLRLVPAWGNANTDVGAVRVFDESGRVRLGRGAGLQWALPDDVRAKLEARDVHLFVEGCEFGARVGLQAKQDGRVTDKITLLVAPLLLPTARSGVHTTYVCDDPDDSRYRKIVGTLELACAEAHGGIGEPTTEPDEAALQRAYRDAPASSSDDEWLQRVPLETAGGQCDYWLQDEFQWAYTQTRFTAMPVAVHLPRGGSLRSWVQNRLGPGVGYYCPVPIPDGDTLSLLGGGNLEVAPPGAAHPLGRICAGYGAGERGLGAVDVMLLRKLESFTRLRRFQPLVTLETWWLSVGHVDEILTFVRCANGGMAMLVASPGAGVDLLEEEEMSATTVPSPFKATYRVAGEPDDYTWGHVLRRDVTSGLAYNLKHYNLLLDLRLFGPSESRRGGIVGCLLARLSAMGLDAPVVVEVPTFFYQADPQHDVQHNPLRALALVPNMVNLVELPRGRLVVPDPHLQEFRGALEDALEDVAPPEDAGGQWHVRWVDTFRRLHLASAGIHCATNQRRDPRSGDPDDGEQPWWEEGGS